MSTSNENLGDIAVIGMAGRFPGARNVAQFWKNLCDGVEGITFWTKDELMAAGINREAIANPNYVPAAGVVGDVDLFDAEFFKISPKDAEITDPQQRLFLEVAWEALETAGYDPELFSGRIGIFAGARMSSYILNVFSHADLVSLMSPFRIQLGNDKDYIPSWTSYKLNLRGPSIAVQTACSSSLVAVHLACQSLMTGECDMALAGGVSIVLPQIAGAIYREGGIVSPDGHCRAFDAEAAGTVRGSGLGLVVLRRLADALSGGDHVRAVIKGSAINNDGALKVGYTAPSVEGQAEVIAEAQALAGVSPETISYIEAHGTGTKLGDPIEIQALTKVFRAVSAKKSFCAVGSVKTNVGHLDTAAGVAGLIKTVLALEHKRIPPSLHYCNPNPAISFADSPFFVNSSLLEWKRREGPRRAGVSSFGIGGTNAHVVLEEAPEPGTDRPAQELQLLALSARTPDALREAAGNLARHLEQNPELSLPDTAYTLACGRRAFEYRTAVIGRNREEVLHALAKAASNTPISAATVRASPIFLFPGQGTQYVNMGGELYEAEPEFCRVVDRCATILKPLLNTDLREVLFPAGDNDLGLAPEIHQTAFTQPAIFVVEYALAQLWMSWGVKPSRMAGHSIGEYVAACLAGVFSLEDSLSIVAMRGQLMQTLSAGAMLSVHLSEAEIQPLLNERLCLAAINGPALTVASGPIAEIAELEDKLTRQGVRHQQLATSHAFHSSMMDAVMQPFQDFLNRFEFHSPKIPFLSNVTGTWITAAQATTPRYWADHMRQPVRFSDVLSELLEDQSAVALEVGAGRTLASLMQYNCVADAAPIVLPSLPGPRERVPARKCMIDSLAQGWMLGVQVEWAGFYQYQQRRRIPLPTYPFRRQRYWIDPLDSFMAASGIHAVPSANPNQSLVGSDASNRREVTTTVIPAENRTAFIVEDASCLSILMETVQDLTGVGTIDPHATFFELGADSLVLVQFVQAIKERLGIHIPYRLLFEDLSSLDSVACHLDAQMRKTISSKKQPEGTVIVPSPETRVPEPVKTGRGEIVPQQQVVAPPGPQEPAAQKVAGNDSVEKLLLQQLHAMSQLVSQQLDTLRLTHTPATLVMAESVQAVPVARVLQAPTSSTPRPLVMAPAIAVPEEQSATEPARTPGSADAVLSSVLKDEQQRYLQGFIDRYTHRTRASKAHINAFRAVLAEPRASMGFRLLWKELVYPIVADRSEGSRIWDLDGNEYVDIAMGFGVTLFGHSPAFILDAIKKQLQRGIHVGPESDQAGRVARLLCELTGMERAIFCNSGTEAVMNAIRFARTATRRRKIVVFAGSYHGSFDATLAKPGTGIPGALSLPRSPGVTEGMVADTIVLPYNDPAALEFIQSNASQLAAVLVEPVQSRRPDIQPRQFLHQLRALTADSGTALIFDEVVTGFRCHLGGAQAWFGVKADIATYGKVIAGGMPIGVIAGKESYIDVADGGAWQFGDNSYPSVDQTFFAGTFCKHPLAMACAWAALNHLKQSGPELQQHLNSRTEMLAATLNAHFRREQVQLAVKHFGSLFYFLPTQPWPHGDLFFYHLVNHGVYLWEGRTCYLSTAHGQADIDHIVHAVQQATEDLRGGGFLEDPASRQTVSVAVDANRIASSGSGQAGAAAKVPETQGRVGPGACTLPVTDGQKQLWFLSQLRKDISAAFHESLTVRLTGFLHVEVMKRALQQLVDRYEILRTTFSPDGERQIVHAAMKLDVPLLDFSHLPPGSSEVTVSDWLRREVQHPFDLVAGPLLRARIVKLGEHRHWLVLTSHHIVTDARSYSVLLASLSRLYSAGCEGGVVSLAEPTQFREYIEHQSVRKDEDAIREDEEYWKQRFADGFPIVQLPADRNRTPDLSYVTGRIHIPLDASLYAKLRTLCAQQECTMFMVLLGTYFLLLRQLSGQDDLVAGINVSQPASPGEADCIGYRINPLAIRCKVIDESSCAELLKEVKRAVVDANTHQNVSVTRLNKALKVRQNSNRLLQVCAIFNLDRKGGETSFRDMQVEVTANHTGYSPLELALNVLEFHDHLELECDYRKALFNQDTIVLWMTLYERILEAVALEAQRRVCTLPSLSSLSKPARPQADPGPDTLDLTQCQRLIWAGQSLHPNAPMFINAGYDIVSDLAMDRGHFERAIQALVAKCDTLRIVIHEKGGIPRQVFLPEMGYVPEYVDLSHCESPREALAEWAARKALVTFVMAERLFDIVLVKLGEGEYARYLNSHHLITDAWSVSLLIRYMSEFYQLACRGLLETAPEIPCFREYVEYERSRMGSSQYRDARAYWQDKLSVELRPLRVYGSPAEMRSTRARRVSCRLGPERTAKLKEAAAVYVLAPSAEASAHNLFGALVAVLLHYVSGLSVIGLGAPFHNRRSRAEVIGLLMQIVPLRVTVYGEDTIGTLASRIGDEQIRNLRHRSFVIGNPANKPAYHIEYNYINARTPDNLDGHTLEHYWVHPGHGVDFLAIQVHLDGNGNYVCELDFNRDAFDEVLRARVVNDFLGLIDTFLASNSRPVRELLDALAPPVTSVHEANGGERVFIELFEEQAQRTPDRTGVCFKGVSLTYAELNSAADAMSLRMLEAGIGPEVLVALLADRSEKYLVMMLALYKARAAYLPLDPRNRATRIRQLLEGSQVAFMLYDADLTFNLEELVPSSETSTAFLCYQDLQRQNTAVVGGTSSERPRLEHLSYVFYTSGSTGAPRGAMVEQRGMLNHLRAKIEDLGIVADDVVAQSAPQCFDVSVWQFLAPLLVGARVEIIADETVRDPLLLMAEIERKGVTILEIVPSQLRAMLQMLNSPGAKPPALSRLRWLFVMGEVLPPEVCQSWYDHYPHVAMVNAYGTTEVSDDVTHYKLPGPPAPGLTRVPVGSPLASVRLHVLEPSMKPVAAGSPGELYIGGICVGRGYRNDPVRTAECFVPDEFSPVGGTRLYRTGDLAMLLPDNTLDFLGRNDFQVKIRGQRVELSEIESALNSHPHIWHAVVLAPEGQDQNKRLVAYVVSKQELVPAELRSFLQERLPDYMVPSHWVFRSELPLNANGKVDRAALPPTEAAAAGLGNGESAAAQSAVERELARIWASVLDVGKVGINDNFFEMGGDSILTIRIVAMAAEAGIRITPTQIFEHQTIATLAQVAGSAQVVSPEQGPVTGPVPLLPIQHWFFAQQFDRYDAWGHSLLLELSDRIDPEIVGRAFAAVVEHHDALRLQCVRVDGAWQQTNLHPGTCSPAFSVIDLAGHDEQACQDKIRAAYEEANAVLNLAEGSLARAVYFDRGSQASACLLLVIHHLMVDGDSWRILIDDLQTASLQFLRGQESAMLPTKTVSYRQWARRLQEYAATPEIEQELAYWIDDGKSTKQIQRDNVSGENRMNSARTVSLLFNLAETRELLEIIPQQFHFKVEEVLLASLLQALGPLSEGWPLRVNLKSHGRDSIFEECDLSRTVGRFTTLYPVTFDLSDARDPFDAAGLVRGKLEQVPNRGAGYGILRYLSGAETSSLLSSLPAAEVSFEYLGQFDHAFTGQGSFRLTSGRAPERALQPGKRPCLLEATALVLTERLRIDISYSEEVHGRSTAELLLHRWTVNLRSFFCSRGEEVRSQRGVEDLLADTPGDQTEANLSEIKQALVV